jgi:hypothetical protein
MVDRRVPGSPSAQQLVWVCPVPECDFKTRSSTRGVCEKHGVLTVAIPEGASDDPLAARRAAIAERRSESA